MYVGVVCSVGYKSSCLFNKPSSVSLGMAEKTTVHLLHLNSSSSAETYPENKLEDFVCKLPQTLILEPVGEWYACLRQCYFGFQFNTDSALYLCCDACTDVISGERKLPVLSTVHQRVGVFYDSCLYVPLKSVYLDRLRFYLLKTTDYSKPRQSPSVKPGKPTHLTLELKRLTDRAG